MHPYEQFDPLQKLKQAMNSEEITRLKRIDVHFLLFLQQSARNDFLDNVMRFITRLGNGGTIWVLCAAVMWFFPKFRFSSKLIAAVLAVGVLTGNLLIKHIASRIRPCVEYPDVELLIKHPTDTSFPSCHTMSSFACATVIMLSANPIIGISAFIVAALIAFSRLYLFVHYPSDVIGGMIWGIMIAFGTYWTMYRFLFKV